MMKSLCKAAGVPYRALHALRHRATLRLKEGGLSLEDRARFLGHANLNTTRIYSEGEGEEAKRVVQGW